MHFFAVSDAFYPYFSANLHNIEVTEPTHLQDRYGTIDQRDSVIESSQFLLCRIDGVVVDAALRGVQPVLKKTPTTKVHLIL